jgi:hypothetical protein
MKKPRIVFVLLAVAMLLAGCVVSSVYPFYTEKDLVFDPALLGRWDSINPQNNQEDTNEFIQFQMLGKSSYFMGMKMSDNETDWFEAHLFVLKGQLFMDDHLPVTNQCFGQGFIAEHYLCKVTNLTNSLQLGWLRLDWLDDLLQKDSHAIRHMEVYDSPDDTNGRTVLTADTKELQKFILKYSADTNAFFEMKYVKEKE